MKPGRKIIDLECVISTNLYLADLTGWQDIEEGTVVRAAYQTGGRGHGKAVWESEAGSNLLFSVFLKPSFLPVTSQFYLSKIISLALKDVVGEYCSDARIKWPNDLYVRNLKIAGILIENTVVDSRIRDTIAGIGLNVNQERFPGTLPNPTSLRLETGRQLELSRIFDRLLSSIDEWYARLKEKQYESIDKEYLRYLYQYMTETTFTEVPEDAKTGSTFCARITGVLESGEIVLQTLQGETRTYSFKEIEYS
jgi:BirA family biotin operon repressor/biotin-[acetyl-CoA-carboxylase] ligase